MYTINPWLIFALILCATAIAITAILCDYCVEKKNIDTNKGNYANETNGTNNTNDSNEFRLSKKIIKIHRNYIAGFLGFAIIMLLTAQFGRSYNAIYNYLSFASTITSLVLSILAIFVTVNSSSDLYKQFTRIDNATETVKNASVQIDGSLNQLSVVETSLKDVSNSIERQINDIVKKVDERLRVRMKETEENISNRIVKQNLQLNKSSSLKQAPPKKTDSDRMSYLDRLPYNGLLIIYACTKAFEKKKRLDLKVYFDKNVWYCIGIIMSSVAAGFIEAHVSGDPEDENVVDCEYSVYSSQEIYGVLEKFKSSYDGALKDDIRKINELFDEK